MSELDDTELAAFNVAMEGVYSRALKECKYNAHIYLDMLHRNGALATAHALLTPREGPQYGFERLWELGRLDITVEYVVLDPRWKPLFSETELQYARQRLLDHGFPADELPS